MRTHQQIAEELLGTTIDPGGYTTCPGAALHTTPGGHRDFRITFDPTGAAMPKAFCFHGSCRPAIEAFMRDLYRAINAEKRADARSSSGGSAPRAPRPLPAAPTAAPLPRRSLDMDAVERIAAQGLPITPADLIAASPIPIPRDRTKWARLLLDHLYLPNERILIFTRYKSQGQYLHEIARGSYRLADTPGIRAVPSPRLPAGGRDGIWFLTAPVIGGWKPNPNNIRDGIVQPGRRHAACITRCPYAVIESDVLDTATWLRILSTLHYPIAAIYTSGGKSIHCLLRVNAPTPEAFAPHRAALLQTLVPLGADPAAITAVRLSRLPGCVRGEKLPDTAAPPGRYIDPADGTPAGLQRLLYLNPRAGCTPRAPLLEQAAAARAYYSQNPPGTPPSLR